MMDYFPVSKLESIINTSIHKDLLKDGLCLKATFVCFKYDDDFMTWAFRNVLMKSKQKKEFCPIFSVPFGATSNTEFLCSKIHYLLELICYLRSLKWILVEFLTDCEYYHLTCLCFLTTDKILCRA